MQVEYVGVFADDGVELADGQWIDGHTPTEVSEDLARGLLAQTVNWVAADDEAKAIAAELEPPVADEPVKPKRHRKTISKTPTQEDAPAAGADDATEASA